MGAGGASSGGTYVKRVNGRFGDLDTHVATPNARYDLYVKGKIAQSRWYDYNGNAVRNRDYFHQDAHHNHTFPHDHRWEWKDGKPYRNPTGLPPDYNNYY